MTGLAVLAGAIMLQNNADFLIAQYQISYLHVYQEVMIIDRTEFGCEYKFIFQVKTVLKREIHVLAEEIAMRPYLRIVVYVLVLPFAQSPARSGQFIFKGS